jgi:GxxExxY protein
VGPKAYEPLPQEIERVATEIVQAAYEVHRHIGPGLLESTYELCLVHELYTRGLQFEQQLALPLVYKGVRLEAGLRLDILVEKAVVVEVKAVEALGPLHQAQLLSYLKLANLRLGFLVNFNVPIIGQGIQRLIL